jgi:hypothetical protein
MVAYPQAADKCSVAVVGDKNGSGPGGTNGGIAIEPELRITAPHPGHIITVSELSQLH